MIRGVNICFPSGRNVCKASFHSILNKVCHINQDENQAIRMKVRIVLTVQTKDEIIDQILFSSLNFQPYSTDGQIKITCSLLHLSITIRHLHVQSTTTLVHLIFISHQFSLCNSKQQWNKHIFRILRYMRLQAACQWYKKKN